MAVGESVANEEAGICYLTATGTLSSWSYVLLDGDISQVEAIDTSRDGGGRVLMRGGMMNGGRPIHPDHLPTRILRKGPKARPAPDLLFAFGSAIVSDALKDLVESFEPGRHQFFPFDFVLKDGTVIARRYFFIVCNRLDSVNREHTAQSFRGGVLFVPDPDEGIVFNLGAVGDAQVWYDKHLLWGLFCTARFARAVDDAGLLGVGVNRAETV